MILIIAGQHAEISGIMDMLRGVTEFGIIPLEIAITLIQILRILGLFGGLFVLLGGILHLTKKLSFIANLLISIGSGVSLFDLLLFMILSAPMVKVILIQRYVEKMSDLGIQYTLLTIGVVLAFLAMISDTIGFTIGFIAGLLANLSSSLAEARLIVQFLVVMGLVNPSPQTIRVIALILFSGGITLIAGIFYGMKKYTFGFILAILGTIIYALHVGIIIVGLIKKLVPPIFPILTFIGLLTIILTVTYGKIKLKRKH